ncbi:MAG: DUF2156 domain-containing protein [Lentisphaeria bacterium]|nr:DUF2156 domain-containing protein [Lentisphaeria bacterium]
MNIFDYASSMKAVPECDPGTMKKALEQSGFPSCEYAFANLRMWAEAFQTRCGMFRGQMYFHMSNIDELLFPCGEGLPEAEDLHAVSEGMKAAGYSGTIAHAPQDSITLPELEKYFQAQPMDDGNDEYIYKTETLADLRGSKLSKKRNLISQFERLYSPYEIREITPEDFDTIRKLNDQWRREHDGMRSIENEQQALTAALSCYEGLGLHGLILTTGGNIEAFAIFSPINSNSWTVHFEKTRSDCKGAAQVINQQTAKYLTGKCEYINREQDLGIPGLRQAKQSYMPDRMLKDFLLIPK